MDILTFVASIISTLSWPIVVLIVALMIRKPFVELFPSLRHAKYKDLDLFFDKKLEELEQKADRASLPAPSEPPSWTFENPDDWTFGDYIERLAIVSPRVAISEAWRYVELALQEAAQKSGKKYSYNTMQMAKELQEAEMLPKDALFLISELRTLRNAAVHAREFDLEASQASEFARMAERIIASIKFFKMTPGASGIG